MLLAFLLWFYIAVLYIASRHKAIALYLILLPFFPFTWAPFYIVPFNALNIQRFMAIGLIGGIILQIFDNIKKTHIHKFNFHLGYALFLMCIIWHISIFEYTTISSWIRMMVFSILDFWFPFYIGMLIAKDGKIVSVLKCIVWSTTIVGLFVFYEFFSQTPIVHNWFTSLSNTSETASAFSAFQPTLRAGMYRVQAGLGQPIFAGFYLSCASFIAFVLNRVQLGYKKKVLYFLIGSFLLIASLFPMARGSFIGFMGAIFIFVLLLKNVSHWKMIFWLAIIMALIWGVSQYMEGVQEFWINFVLTVIGKASVNVQSEQLLNWEARLEMIRKGIELLGKAPTFGYGDISFGGAWIIRDICNVFVLVALQAGIPGLLLLITFLLSIGIQGFQIWKREKNAKNMVLASGMMGCYILVFISWMDSSWPGQFTQLGFFTFGLIHGWAISNERFPLKTTV